MVSHKCHSKVVICTWNFHVDANTPVRGPFGAVDIQVTQAHFLHGRNDLPCFVITRHANLVSIPRILGRIKRVDKMCVGVRDG
jgi:hypothetical protein